MKIDPVLPPTDARVEKVNALTSFFQKLIPSGTCIPYVSKGEHYHSGVFVITRPIGAPENKYSAFAVMLDDTVHEVSRRRRGITSVHPKVWNDEVRTNLNKAVLSFNAEDVSREIEIQPLPIYLHTTPSTIEELVDVFSSLCGATHLDLQYMSADTYEVSAMAMNDITQAMYRENKTRINMVMPILAIAGSGIPDTMKAIYLVVTSPCDGEVTYSVFMFPHLNTTIDSNYEEVRAAFINRFKAEHSATHPLVRAKKTTYNFYKVLSTDYVITRELWSDILAELMKDDINKVFSELEELRQNAGNFAPKPLPQSTVHRLPETGAGSNVHHHRLDSTDHAARERSDMSVRLRSIEHGKGEFDPPSEVELIDDVFVSITVKKPEHKAQLLRCFRALATESEIDLTQPLMLQLSHLVFRPDLIKVEEK